MKRKLVTILIGCMTLGLFGCGSGLSDTTKRLTPQQPEDSEQNADHTGNEDQQAEADTTEKKAEDDSTETTFGYRYRQFALNLLQQTYEDGKNEMISPLSVLAALTMTENGAKGNTLSQMEQVLSDGTPVGQQGRELSSYMKKLTDTENEHLNIANSIWLKDADTLHVEDDFLSENSKLFDAEIYQAPFDEHTLKDINTWVSQKTEKMIPKILDKIEDNSVMYLINAIAFDAKWQSPYEKEDVEAGTFTSENGTQQTVDMMYSTEAYYLEDDSTTGFIRPYEDGYSFMALLPKEGISIEDYISHLSAEKLIGLVENVSTDYDVDAAIPKFKSEYSIELKDTLQNMGMTDAFDEEQADVQGGVLAVWGSPSSGKTTVSVKLADYLARKKKNVLLIFADMTTPPLPCICAAGDLEGEKSLGSILAATHVTENLIKKNCMFYRKNDYLSMVGMLKGENVFTYPPYDQTQAAELIEQAREVVPFVIIDCGSTIASDVLSAVALMEADTVLRLINCDLKSISYLSSQLPLLRDNKWDADKQLKVASNVKQQEASSHMEQVLGSVSFQIPHSREVETQYLEGDMLAELGLKESRAFRKEIEKISKEVFGV